MEIGQKLKNKRMDARLSQETLAERIGVSRQTISNWENNRSYPDIGSILKLSDLYDVSLDELLKEDENMRKHVEKTASLTGKFWNGLFVSSILLLPISMLLIHWGWNTAGSATKILSMVLLLVVLFFRWKLSGGKKSELVIGMVFWALFFIPDLIGLIGPGKTVVKSMTIEYILLGILLIYGYGVCFKTRLGFWLTMILYFGAPIFIAVSTHLPLIMEHGDPQSACQSLWNHL